MSRSTVDSTVGVISNSILRDQDWTFEHHELNASVDISSPTMSTDTPGMYGASVCMYTSMCMFLQVYLICVCGDVYTVMICM